MHCAGHMHTDVVNVASTVKYKTAGFEAACTGEINVIMYMYDRSILLANYV